MTQCGSRAFCLQDSGDEGGDDGSVGGGGRRRRRRVFVVKLYYSLLVDLLACTHTVACFSSIFRGHGFMSPHHSWKFFLKNTQSVDQFI